MNNVAQFRNFVQTRTPSSYNDRYEYCKVNNTYKLYINNGRYKYYTVSDTYLYYIIHATYKHCRVSDTME